MNHLLILTNSYDATTDLLLDRIGNASIFRLNFDQMTQYVVRFDADGFSIGDPTGRTVTSKTVGKVYWRKPFHGESEDRGVCGGYVESEMRYVLTEIVNLLWAEGKMVLVEPFAERRVGKLAQLRHARRFFAVPAHEFVLNSPPCRQSAVVKSLSNRCVGDRVLYTTAVHTSDLDQQYPWFVEEYVEATHDVTVVFIRGRIFAFSLERDFLKRTIDWRECLFEEQNWTPHLLSANLSAAISAYMNSLRLDFGRFDFLLDAEGRYWFCELNPNGQFAWLDMRGEYGLLDAVIDEISSATPCHPIPNRHPLDRIL